MFLINLLNRSITDRYYPLFECFYTVEIFLVIVQFVMSIPLIKAIWKSQLHRNLRLRLIFCILYTCLSSSVRIYVIHHQFYGSAEKALTIRLVACSMIRRAFFAYFGSLAFYIAMDRFIASRHWNWYDNGGLSTTFFFSVLEAIHLSLSFLDSYLLVYDYLSDFVYMAECGVFVIIGISTYFLVYRSDYQEMEKILKNGPTIDSYSVTRSYQLRENINLMQMFTKMSRPIGISCSPEILVYALMTFIPPGKYDTIRYISCAIFDVWIAVISVVAYVLIPLCQPQIARHMPTRLQFSSFNEKISIEKRNLHKDTNTYFDELMLRWQSNNRVNPSVP